MAKKRTKKKHGKRLSKAHSRYHKAAVKVRKGTSPQAVALTRLRTALRQAEALFDRDEHSEGRSLAIHARKVRRKGKRRKRR